MEIFNIESINMTVINFFSNLDFRETFVYVIICCSSFYIIKLARSLNSPFHYKRDMTKKPFRKRIGEINNEYGFHESIGAQKIKFDNSSRKTKFATNRSSLDDSPMSEDDIRYVNGWIPVVESFKVGPGQVKKATIYGKDLIVTRSHDGHQVNILDAYCPHGGAHIGVGGSVKSVDGDSCVQCPFHGWAFRAKDGKCMDIPYQEKRCIPSQARIASWTCCEVDGFIYLWHDMDGKPPNWTMTETPEVMNKKWVLNGRTCHKSNLELEYMQENGADLNHFASIHEDLIFLGNIENLSAYKYLQKYVRHCWEPSWNPINDNSGRSTHQAQLSLRSYTSLFGLKLIEFNVVANQIGPARVKLLYSSKYLGRGMLSMNGIPTKNGQVKYIQHLYNEPSFLDRLRAKFILYGEVKMLERDMVVWNHKKYLKNPVLVPEDKTVRKFKLWYSQFYKRKVKIADDENIIKSKMFGNDQLEKNNSPHQIYKSDLEF